MSLHSHEELLRVISLLQTDIRLDEFVDHLQPQYGDKVLLHASIDFATRIWLTVAVGTLPESLAPGNNVTWNDGKLSETIRSLWPEPQLSDSIKLPKSFNAASLEKILGKRIEWTSNLVDHLRLEQDDTTVLLYHQALFLELHIESKWLVLLFLKVVNFDEVRSSILQHDLIEETGRTLGLLIPFGDKKTKAWFQRKQRELGLDPKVGTYGPLNAAGRQIESFKY